MKSKNRIIIGVCLSVMAMFIFITMGFVFVFDKKEEPNFSQELLDAETAAVQDASSKGGAIFLEENTSYTMKGGSIVGGTADYGGAIYVSKGATFTLEKGTISSCSATTSGGAIYVAAGGTCIIEDGTINGCNAVNGGAIYVESGGKLEIIGGTISSNTASNQGGGIYLTNGTYLISDAKITENSALNHGGGIYSYNSAISLTNTEISDNSVTSTETDAAQGGGIYARNKTLDISGGIIKGNYSKFRGGGIYSNSATVQITDDALFIRNNSSGGSAIAVSGGNLYLGTDSKDWTGSISENCVTGSGAGILITSSGVVFHKSGTIGKATVNQINYRGNVANEGSSASKAGGIYIYSGGTYNLQGGKVVGNEAQQGAGIYQMRGTFNFEDGEVSKNTASEYGGGIVVGDYSTVAFNMTGGTILDNNAPIGAGIYSIGKTTISGGKIDGCIASNYGGGIAVLRTSTCTISALTIQNCSATNNGGGIYASGQELIIKGYGIEDENGFGASVLIKGNLAASGAGIYLATSLVKAEFYDFEASENIASENGGGIYCDSSSFKLQPGYDYGNVVNQNEAKNGGGIFLDSNTQASMDDLCVSYNKAAESGGGIYSLAEIGNKNSFTNSEINYNTADSCGGGIYIGTGLFEVGSTEEYISWRISNNKALLGGGIYAQYQDNCILSVYNSEISNNTAISCGGGIYADTFVTVKNGKIDENNSSYQGAGIWCSEGLDITDSSVSNNTLANSSGSTTSDEGGRGAGIYVGVYYEYAELTANNVKIDDNTINTNNSKHYGAGVYIERDVKATIYSGSVSGNKMINGDAENYGAGIYAVGELVLGKANGKASDLIISGNQTTGNGGGIALYYSPQAATIYAATIKDNSASSGGGMFINGHTATLNSEVVISGNTCSTRGGGVFANNAAKLTINGAEVTGNSAPSGGGGLCIYKNCSLTMTSGLISSNTTTTYGAGIQGYNNATLNISGGEISNNSGASGAGISAQSGSTVIMTGGKVLTNIASTRGGGIYLSQSSLDMSNLEIFGNKAPSGGGICVYNSSALTMNSGLISSNTVNSNGGGIYAYTSSIVNIKGGSITNNGAATGEYSGAASGGGIAAQTNTIINMTGGYIINNVARTRGGGVNIATGSEFTITGGQITGGSANFGGGVNALGASSSDSDGKIYIQGGLIGGTAYLDLVGKVLSKEDLKGKILDVDYKTYVGNVSNIHGAGVQADNGSLIEMTAGTISYNTAGECGGAVCVRSGSLFKMTNGDLVNNNALSSGAVHCASSNMIIAGGNISNNTARYMGGAMCINSAASEVEISNVTIEQNKVLVDEQSQSAGSAPGRAGAIAVQNSALSIGEGTIIQNNYVQLNQYSKCPYGAGLYINNSTVNMTDGLIHKNYFSDGAAQKNSLGGNVLVEFDSRFNFTGGKLSCDGLTTQAYFGGAIASFGTTIVNGGTIENCKAVYGGAIANFGGITQYGYAYLAVEDEITGEVVGAKLYEALGDLQILSGSITGCTISGEYGKDIISNAQFTIYANIADGLGIALASSTLENEPTIDEIEQRNGFIDIVNSGEDDTIDPEQVADEDGVIPTLITVNNFKRFDLSSGLIGVFNTPLPDSCEVEFCSIKYDALTHDFNVNSDSTIDTTDYLLSGFQIFTKSIGESEYKLVYSGLFRTGSYFNFEYDKTIKIYNYGTDPCEDQVKFSFNYFKIAFEEGGRLYTQSDYLYMKAEDGKLNQPKNLYITELESHLIVGEEVYIDSVYCTEKPDLLNNYYDEGSKVYITISGQTTTIKFGADTWSYKVGDITTIDGKTVTLFGVEVWKNSVAVTTTQTISIGGDTQVKIILYYANGEFSDEYITMLKSEENTVINVNLTKTIYSRETGETTETSQIQTLYPSYASAYARGILKLTVQNGTITLTLDEEKIFSESLMNVSNVALIGYGGLGIEGGTYITYCDLQATVELDLYIRVQSYA